MSARAKKLTSSGSLRRSYAYLREHPRSQSKHYWERRAGAANPQMPQVGARGDQQSRTRRLGATLAVALVLAVSQDVLTERPWNAPSPPGVMHRRSQRRRLGTKANHMCPPGFPLCHEHKRKRKRKAMASAGGKAETGRTTTSFNTDGFNAVALVAAAGEKGVLASGSWDLQKRLRSPSEPTIKEDPYGSFMLSRQTPEERAGILARREARRNHHRVSSLKYLRQQLLEESRWEEAQAAAALAQAAEAAAVAANAEGAAAAAVAPRRRSRREIEREEMAAWLSANAAATVAASTGAGGNRQKGVIAAGSWSLRGGGGG